MVKGQCDTRPVLRSSSATSGLRLARDGLGPWWALGFEVWEGGQIKLMASNGGGWCVLPTQDEAGRRTRLPAKLQVELISRERGKGWGRYYAGKRAPRACQGGDMYPSEASRYPVLFARVDPSPAAASMVSLFLRSVCQDCLVLPAVRHETVLIVCVICASTEDGWSLARCELEKVGL